MSNTFLNMGLARRSDRFMKAAHIFLSQKCSKVSYDETEEGELEFDIEQHGNYTSVIR